MIKGRNGPQGKKYADVEGHLFDVSKIVKHWFSKIAEFFDFPDRIMQTQKRILVD